MEHSFPFLVTFAFFCIYVGGRDVDVDGASLSGIAIEVMIDGGMICWIHVCKERARAAVEIEIQGWSMLGEELNYIRSALYYQTRFTCFVLETSPFIRFRELQPLGMGIGIGNPEWHL